MLARFYNVGATLRELAEMLLHLTGRRRPISYAPRSQATLVRHRVGSTLRAAREIAFTARIALPDGLRRLIDWRSSRAAQVERRRAETALTATFAPPRTRASTATSTRTSPSGSGSCFPRGANAGGRDGLRAHLSSLGIASAVYYPVPLHLQPCFRSLGYARGDFPISEQAAEEVLALPIYPELCRDQQARVVRGMTDYFGLA